MGGVGFTPIINPPEVAILGYLELKKFQFLKGGKLTKKLFCQYALSYDHRVINGADAGKFYEFS